MLSLKQSKGMPYGIPLTVDKVINKDLAKINHKNYYHKKSISEIK